MNNHIRWTRYLAAALLLALVAGQAAGSPRDFSGGSVLYGLNLVGTPTMDATDAVGAYLEPNTLSRIADLDVLTLGLVASPPVTVDVTLVAYNAPAIESQPAIMANASPQVAVEAPPAQLASMEYPHLAGLAEMGADGRSVPLGNTTFLAMGPGGYGTVLAGRPTAGMANWSHASQTALSYIRPHVNVQMMFALELPGRPQEGGFEGPGAEPHAYFAVDHQTKVDSRDLGSGTDRFGGRGRDMPVDEPQTAVTAGLDLGLLPTFLSQMGLGLSVVASRGRDTGDVRVALVGTTELPVDWAPYERPYQHPRSTPQQPYLIASNPEPQYPTPSIGGGVPREPPTPIRQPPTPITPVPEPATLALLGVAAAFAAIRRRLRRG